MGKFKSTFIAFAVIIAVVIIWIIANFGIGGNDYARITALDYRAEVVDEKTGDNGRIRITERLTFDVHASSEDNLFWELWRDLPEEKVDDVLVSYNVISVKRLTVNGQSDPLVFEKANRLYTIDADYITSSYNSANGLGPNKWFHSKGPYNESEDRYECLLIYVNGLYRQTVEFEIVYEMLNASLRYGDCSEMYISLFSGKDIKYLKSVTASILVPNSASNDKMPEAGCYTANTYGTNSNSFPFQESDAVNPGYHTFSFSLDESRLKFKPYNTNIEFSLVSFGKDKYKFTEFASVNSQYNKDIHSKIVSEQEKFDTAPARFKMYKTYTLVILLAIAAFLIIIVFLIDRFLKAKYKFSAPTVDYEYFRDIPEPLDTTFAGALVFCKHKLSDDVPGGYAATMLSLIRKGYVLVDKIDPNKDWTESNTIIRIKKLELQEQGDVFDNSQPPVVDTRPPLSQSEDIYYRLILRHIGTSDGIAIKTLSQRIATDYEATEQFIKSTKGAIKSTGVSKGYFSKPDYKKLKSDSLTAGIVFIVIGLIITVAANLISWQTRLELAFGAFFVLGAGFVAAAVFLWIKSKKYILLTQTGEDEYAKWRGLYKFLDDFSLMSEKTVPEVTLWEDYLVYATAFGISEKVIKALNVKFPEFNPNSSLIIGHPFLCSMMFTHSYNRSFRSVTRAASVASWGSRIGGGGGYGGGGRGGGGGGGGH